MLPKVRRFNMIHDHIAGLDRDVKKPLQMMGEPHHHGGAIIARVDRRSAWDGMTAREAIDDDITLSSSALALLPSSANAGAEKAESSTKPPCFQRVVFTRP